jgi:uncharacterized protein
MRQGLPTYIRYTYTSIVAVDLGFDWDAANIGHIARHGVTPHEVEQVFANDEAGISYDVVGGEERWTVVGHTDQGRVLIVAYTMRNELTRTITAFEASGRLRSIYLAKKGN